MSELTDALRAYQQADNDGVMVLVSRQACDEGAARIEALERDNAALRGALTRLALTRNSTDEAAWDAVDKMLAEGHSQDTAPAWPTKCLQPDAMNSACKCCQRWFRAKQVSMECHSQEPK